MFSSHLLGRAKDKILSLMYEHPLMRYHMREVERQTHEHINSVREALSGLTKEGLLTEERLGRKLFFQANPNYKYYDEFLRITAKTTGVGAKIINERLKLGKIRLAFISGAFYQHRARKPEDIDLFIVGTVSLVEISKLAKSEGEKRETEINYSVMSPEEFVFRKKNKDPFLLTILQKNKLVLCGSEDYLDQEQ